MSTVASELQFVATMTSVTDGPVPGSWDGVSGGDTTSNARTYRSGGMAEPEAYGTPPTTDDVTLERAYRGTVDGPLRKQLLTQIGEEFDVTTVQLDNRKRPIPETRETARCILKGVSKPQLDSEGENVQKYRVTLTPSGGWS